MILVAEVLAGVIVVAIVLWTICLLVDWIDLG